MNRKYFLLIAILSTIYIIREVRKKRFSIKESFWWMVASLIMLILAIFPYSIDKIAKLFGVEYPPSLLFVFCILFLIFMNFKNSKRISEQQIKLIELAQQTTILKEQVKDESKKTQQKNNSNI